MKQYNPWNIALAAIVPSPNNVTKEDVEEMTWGEVEELLDLYEVDRLKYCHNEK